MATYKKYAAKGGTPIQVQSAIEDGAGKNIENTYAKQDGYYAKLGAGTSDVAKAIESDRQIDNPEVACLPIVFGTTGGEAEIESGFSKFEALYGNTLKWNQQINGNILRNGNINAWSYDNNTKVFRVAYDNTSGTSTTFGIAAFDNCPFVYNHKYYVRIKQVSGTTLTTIYIVQSNQRDLLLNPIIVGDRYETSIQFSVYIYAGTSIDSYFTLEMFDLTDIYGEGNEPNAQEFDARFPALYPYSASQIISSKPYQLISRQKNQCSGLDQFIRVVPNTEYELSGITSGGILEEYDANKTLINTTSNITSTLDITLSANTYYVKIKATTSSNVMFYITWGVYNEPYEPYEEDVIQLPNIEINGIGDARDVLYQTGGGLRYIKKVDLGSFDYNAVSSGYIRTNSRTKLSNAKGGLSAGNCASYSYNYQGAIGDHPIDKCVYIHPTNKYIYITDSAFTGKTMEEIKALLSGVILYFVLAEPEEITTGENPGWQEFVKTNNFGTLEFTTNPQQIPQVLQPYFIKYTVNLVEFLDSTYVRAEGDANNLALQSDVDNKLDKEVFENLNITNAAASGSLSQKGATQDSLTEDFSTYGSAYAFLAATNLFDAGNGSDYIKYTLNDFDDEYDNIVKYTAAAHVYTQGFGRVFPNTGIFENDYSTIKSTINNLFANGFPAMGITPETLVQYVAATIPQVEAGITQSISTELANMGLTLSPNEVDKTATLSTALGNNNKIYSPVSFANGYGNIVGDKGFPQATIGAFASGWNMKAWGDGAMAVGERSSFTPSAFSTGDDKWSARQHIKHLQEIYNAEQGNTYWKSTLPSALATASTNEEYNAITVEMGEAHEDKAVALGGSSTFAPNSLVTGYSNFNTGINAVVFNNQNVNSGSNSIVGGLGNLNTGSDCLVFGMHNQIQKPSGSGSMGHAVFGQMNNISGTNGKEYDFIAGHHNKITDISLYGGKTVLGRWNYEKADTLLEIGNGNTTDGVRSNAFEVTATGIARAYGAPVGGYDLTPKSYVDARVSANPAETASGNLSKIGIGGTVYNIPSGGGELYVHIVGITDNQSNSYIIRVLTSSASAFSTASAFFAHVTDYAFLEIQGPNAEPMIIHYTSNGSSEEQVEGAIGFLDFDIENTPITIGTRTLFENNVISINDTVTQF